jgi:hypothetical protein
MPQSLAERFAQESDEIVARIRPLLAGRLPFVQGLVVAELQAIWLAGHPADLEESLITEHLKAVRELTALYRTRHGPG